MFNPQALSKDSPMAHVWLASSMDRKLSKNNYIRTNIVAVVEEIKGEQNTGSSLRLSGQLLFGVSTIYQRKTLYLKEDCDSALQSLKTFKPGNVDVATGNSNTAKESSLVLQDQITDLNINNLMPEFPGFGFDEEDDDMVPMTQIPGEVSIAADDSIELGRGVTRNNDGDEDVAGDEDDLGLDFADEEDEEVGDHSVEVGLERPPARAEGEDLGLEGNDSILPKGLGADDEEMPAPDDDGGINMDIDLDLGMDQDLGIDLAQEDQIQEQAPQQGKRKPTRVGKVTQFDSQNMLPSDQVRQTQEDFEHGALNQRPLPENQEAFMIYQMQQKNEFVTAMYLPGGAFNSQIAELYNPQKLMSLMAQGNDEEQENAPSKHARTEENLVDGQHEYEDLAMGQDQDVGGVDFEWDEAERRNNDNDNNNDEEENSQLPDIQDLPQEEPVLFATNGGDENSDESSVNGISRNTLQAARILRTEMPSPDDMSSFDVVSSGSNRPDKVKMFFEMLVLATKNAISVEQDVAFDDITVKAKDGLFGEALTA